MATVAELHALRDSLLTAGDAFEQALDDAWKACRAYEDAESALDRETHSGTSTRRWRAYGVNLSDMRKAVRRQTNRHRWPRDREEVQDD